MPSIHGRLSASVAQSIAPTRGRVVLATEGTYPFGGGGVGTWCHQLCGGLRGFSFTVLAVTGTPHATWQYERLGAVRDVMQVPLWPGEEPAMFLTPGPYAKVLRRRWRTTTDVVVRDFLPALRTFLREVFEGGRDVDEVVDSLVTIGRYLRIYDFKATMRERVVWEAFQAAAESAQRSRTTASGELSLGELTICARWFYNMMLPLAAHIGEASIFHATVAASCALPGIMARVVDGVPFLLTEHGVYLRERYIAVSSSGYADLQKRFLVGLAAAVSRACYHSADIITSVASFNKRWQIPWGAPADRLRVVYNGVDTKRFRPGVALLNPDGRPTLIAAAHLYALKDIETMIRAVDVARSRVPNIRLQVYGSKTVDAAYVTMCEALVNELGLADHVQLRGLHPNPAQIFWGADLSVLSSISEGFPYSILESMASGVPCVATDVGGVREAVGDAGIVVPPRHPEALGTAIADLLLDHDRRRGLALRSLDRVVAQFTLQHQLDGYQAIYDELIGVRDKAP